MPLTHPYFDLLVLPLLIFCLRICDMTLDTLRIIFMTKGLKRLAPIIGFFEILIWIFAITRIMQHLNSWVCYVAYAGGFATGNYVGMLVDEKLAIGHESIRVITRIDATDLTSALRDDGYGVTTVKASGMQGDVGILYIVVNRKNQKRAIQIIRQYNPNAFITIQNIQYVNRPDDSGVLEESTGSRLLDSERESVHKD
ncbi:MAG TPA: DUF2179 domain-containing protein [Verrucomicrobiae bacterium]|nr:DUF2179 domain-containing protein [Verrucomicrobiae bacterium]